MPVANVLQRDCMNRCCIRTCSGSFFPAFKRGVNCNQRSIGRVTSAARANESSGLHYRLRRGEKVLYLMTLDGFKNEGNTIGFASSDMKQQPPAPSVTKMFCWQGYYWVEIIFGGPCLDVGCSHDGVAKAVDVTHTDGRALAVNSSMSHTIQTPENDSRTITCAGPILWP